MKMRFITLFAAASLLFPFPSVADRVLSQETVAFAIDRSGDKWAFITAKPSLLAVRNNLQELRTELRELDSVSDVVPSPSIEWSQDGKYILIRYRNEESSSSVEIYESRSLKRVLIYPVSDARWMKAGQYLVIVPTSGELGENESRGLLLINVKTAVRHRVADQFKFVGRLDAGMRHVIAQAFKKGDKATTEFVRVNVFTGVVD